jgi:hypothetical protein
VDHFVAAVEAEDGLDVAAPAADDLARVIGCVGD